jgi:hypothetical protein
MGFRFRKSIKLFPGVRINLSKTGASTSIGSPGATVNLSRRGVRGTVGIPGTGLSYSERLNTDAAGPNQGGKIGVLPVIFVIGLAIGAWLLSR